MNIPEIVDFDSFCAALRAAGFSMGGGNAKGVFALIPFGWEDNPPDSVVRWHTGDPEHDPWEWRMRVLEECDDIAYSKLFFNTSGYISAEWYPAFYSIRRRGKSFDDAYSDGGINQYERRIYEIIQSGEGVPLHEIKRLGEFSKEENAKFNSAITSLQMKMFITMCGRTPKISRTGEPYGWNSTVFMTAERFWEQRSVTLEYISPDDAEAKIRRQLQQISPSADERRIKKFILGQ